MRPVRHQRHFANWLAGALASAWLAMGPMSANASIATAQAPARSYYLVSLDQASLAEAAEAVLVQSLRSQAVVDPGLAGTVTFRVSEPLTDRELEERFALALADRGIALVRVDDGFRLMDLRGAQAARPRLDVVTVEAPPMKPGAIPASRPAVPPKPSSIAPKPTTIEVLTVLGAVLAAFALSGVVWLKRANVRVFSQSGAARSKRSKSRDDARDAIIDHLLSDPSIDLASLAAACDRAAKEGRPVEQALCDLDIVSEQQLADAYSTVTGLARWEGRAGETPVSADLSALVTYVRERPLKIIAADDWSVSIATADPFDDRTFATLSRLSGRMVTLQIGRRSDLPFGGQTTPAGSSGLVIPWFRSSPPDGARLLQAILARRLANETA